jgi:acyl-CoA thioesterase I
MKKFSSVILCLSALLLSACGGGSPGPAVIVAFGDSLTENKAEFVTISEHWTEKLKTQITASGLDANRTVEVIDEGIGGENSDDALKRLPGVLAKYKPTHIILTHGTNDIPPFCCGYFAQPQANLEAMASLAKQAGVIVIMGEFTLKVYGDDISKGYTNMYTQAAKNSNSTYVNLVKDIPYDAVNYQPDGVHFMDAAQEAIKNNLVSALFPLMN